MLANDTLLQDRYRVIEQIGRGGMGAVYKAMDTRLRSVVALKQTLVEGEPLSKAFEREARLLASLRHPTLPRVSDHFIEASGQFLVMEFIPGADLGTMLAQRKRPFDVADVLRWGDELLDVLDYLHSRTPPVVHRDIKPQNLKLTDRNEMILLDFGLAKGSLAHTRVTSTGSIFGYTPHYAPLEQIHSTGTDCRSDLYSLAATLYHLMTDRTPVDAVTRATARVNDEPDPQIPANEVNPNVPPAIAALLHQAMSLKANQRPPTAAAMRTALRNAAQGITLADLGDRTIVDMPDEPLTPEKPKETQTKERSGRRRGWVWAAVAVPVLLAIGAAGLFLSGANLTASQPTATSESIVAAPTLTSVPPTDVPPTVDILAAAGATQTSVALLEGETSTARAEIVNRNDATRTAVSAGTAAAVAKTEQAAQTTLAAANAEAATQTALAAASAEAATQAALAAASAEAATQAAIEQQTALARPTATPRPLQPTRAPAPPTAVPEQTAECRVQGRGSQFAGSCSPGGRIGGVTGSCITGRVIANDGSAFQTVLLSVDIGGSTIRVPLDGGRYDASNGSYSVCGLRGGEWGVTVINVNRGNGIEGNPDQAGSQVIVRLSGADGEHAVVSFRE